MGVSHLRSWGSLAASMAFLRFRRCLPVLAVLVFAAAPIPAHAQAAKAELKKTVETFIKEYIGAWKKLDAKQAGKVFEKYTLPSYVATNAGSGETARRDDIVKTYAEKMKPVNKLLAFEIILGEIQAQGDKATVKFKYRIKAEGTFGHPDGKKHTLETKHASTWNWQKTKTGWKGKASLTKVESALVDGKPAPGSGGG